MIKFHLIFFAILLTSLFNISPTFGNELVCLVSNNSHYALVHRIEAALFQTPNIHATTQHFLVEKTASETYQDTIKKSALVVTIGSKALKAVLENDINTPILSILIRQAAFEAILQEHGRTLQDKNRPIAVFYLDQPLSRQFNLMNVLFKDNAHSLRLGILLSLPSRYEEDTLKKIAQEKNILLQTAFVKASENPIKVLDSILDKVDGVLALPDPKIYHTKMARGILLTAFHKQVPIISYSHTFVNNGALAAVYSNAQHISAQTTQTIITILQHTIDSISKEQYPSDYAIAINHQVAKSLGLSLSDEETIKLLMDKFEHFQNKVTA